MSFRKKELLLIRKIELSWRKAVKSLLPMGGISYGNKVEIFHDSDQAFLKMIEAIRRAKSTVYLETYIFAQDNIGRLFRDELLKAAERKVKISILYDYVGSYQLSRHFFEPLIRLGVEVLAFNPIWPWQKKGPLLFRDHRKILVIDEQEAFCGSANISEYYVGKLHGGRDYYRDSIAHIIGPAAKDLLGITLESIEMAMLSKSVDSGFKKPDDISLKEFLEKVFDGTPNKMDMRHGVIVQVLRSNTRRGLTHIQNSMEECLGRAVSHCYLTTPYFLPYKSLKKAIINAKRRGVDVRILTAGLPDVPLIRNASQHVYQQFLDEGIRIYEMWESNLHAKNATIDNFYSSVGSYNLDQWSFRRNLEVTVSIFDKTTAEDLRVQFLKDVEVAHEISAEKFARRSFWAKIVGFLSYLLFRL